jgi:hypothetical protein
MPEHYVSGLEPTVWDTSSRGSCWHLTEDRHKVAIPVRLEYRDRWRLGLRVDRGDARPGVYLLNKRGTLLGGSGRRDPPRIAMYTELAGNIQPLASYNFSMVKHKSVAVGSPLGLSRSATNGLLCRTPRALKLESNDKVSLFILPPSGAPS